MSRLNCGKNDGSSGLSTDHIIDSAEKLHADLAFLFTAMLRHGSVPEDMILSTVIPILKNFRKSINDSENYRA